MKNRNKNFWVIILLFFTISCSEEETENVDINETSLKVWKGDLLTFEKADGADPDQASNQDRISDNVWITRGNDGGQIFNIAKENNADKNKSPIGTRWAVGSIDDIGSLSFDDFRSAVGQPKSIVGKNLVLHLQEDDIYCSVKFTSWSSGSKGGFSYERTTP
tara:strand:- start:3458 stop:3943 length:486 start_codon:yes stop_codon:yes gene_type:complete